MAEAVVSKGMFIVIEGGEGAGKSTQAERLHRRLQDERRPAALVREPGTTPLGLHLREYLKSKRPLTPQAELLLFTAARAQLIHEHIRPSLQRGITVIADRFAASTIAYQGHGRRIPLEVIEYLNNYATDGLKPDLTFLLDIDPEQGLHRIGRPQLQMSLSPNAIADPTRADIAGHRRFEDQSLSFHRQVRQGYQKLANGNPQSWRILNAQDTEDELARQIWQEIAPRLPAPSPNGLDLEAAALI